MKQSNYNKVTYQDLINELERELLVRRKLYPKWQMVGTITAETAYHRIHCLEALLTLLKRFAPKPPQQLDMFAEFQALKDPSNHL